MFGLAMVLKKGLHIHIIHEVERPIKDMMLGLENWIPLYMTGQISPYYLKGIQNKVYSHLHYSSGQAAMTGDCISGHHENAHYYLTSHKEEVERCRKNTEYLCLCVKGLRLKAYSYASVPNPGIHGCKIPMSPVCRLECS